MSVHRGITGERRCPRGVFTGFRKGCIVGWDALALKGGASVCCIGMQQLTLSMTGSGEGH